MSVSTGAPALWVGRSLRRVEDPALVTGRGRFTGDLPAALFVRFVRASVAAGRIVRITAPDATTVISSVDLNGVQPIRPMLHKFNYVPIAQPILADGVVRYVGEAIAAVVAKSAEEAEDIVDRVEVEIDETVPVVDARSAVAGDGSLVHDTAPSNVIVEGHVKTPGFDAARAAAKTFITLDVPKCHT
jgi:carbon-monoxide dehydrogenase large subunit